MKPSTLFLLLIATGAFGQNIRSSPYSDAHRTYTFCRDCDHYNADGTVTHYSYVDIDDPKPQPTIESLSAEIADLKARVAELEKLEYGYHIGSDDSNAIASCSDGKGHFTEGACKSKAPTPKE